MKAKSNVANRDLWGRVAGASADFNKCDRTLGWIAVLGKGGRYSILWFPIRIETIDDDDE